MRSALYHAVVFGFLGSVLGATIMVFISPHERGAWVGLLLGGFIAATLGAVLRLAQAVNELQEAVKDLRRFLKADSDDERRRPPTSGGIEFPRIDLPRYEEPLPKRRFPMGDPIEPLPPNQS